MTSVEPPADFSILDLVKCRVITAISNDGKSGSPYHLFFPDPCKGVLFVTPDSPHFIHGRMAVKGRKGGVYPDHFLEAIDHVFGPEKNTIEVCSRTVEVDDVRTAFTVDLDPKRKFNPSLRTDAQVLQGVENGRFNRWRGDPHYNEQTGKTMYDGVPFPEGFFKKLITAGARVCKVGSLLFMLLGPDNYQHVPPGVMRVGLIYISVIPNNETRALNIYYKFAEADPDQQKLF